MNAFLIRIANFSDHPLHIKRNMLFAIARPTDNFIVSPSDAALLTFHEDKAMSPLPKPPANEAPALFADCKELAAPSLPNPKM